MIHASHLFCHILGIRKLRIFNHSILPNFESLKKHLSTSEVKNPKYPRPNLSEGNHTFAEVVFLFSGVGWNS